MIPVNLQSIQNIGTELVKCNGMQETTVEESDHGMLSILYVKLHALLYFPNQMQHVDMKMYVKNIS